MPVLFYFFKKFKSGGWKNLNRVNENVSLSAFALRPARGVFFLAAPMQAGIGYTASKQKKWWVTSEPLMMRLDGEG